MGPWKPVSLQTYTARITDLRISTDVSEAFDVKIKVSVQSSAASGKAEILLKDPKGNVVQKVDSTLTAGKTTAEFKGAKDDFELWYPVGYGKQPIYSVEVHISDDVSTDICQTYSRTRTT